VARALALLCYHREENFTSLPRNAKLSGQLGSVSSRLRNAREQRVTARYTNDSIAHHYGQLVKRRRLLPCRSALGYIVKYRSKIDFRKRPFEASGAHAPWRASQVRRSTRAAR